MHVFTDSRAEPKKHGSEFANKSLFYAFKQWHVPVEDVQKEEFDGYFGRRFGIGLRIEDNMRQHEKSVAQILRSHGIEPGGS